MELVGYARVSTRESQQVFDRQVDALRAAGCERIYDDRGSGASTERPGLKACLDYLRRGDVLVVLDLDRLGRLAGELIRLVDELEARSIGFRALNASFDTTTPMGRAFLQIQAAFPADRVPGNPELPANRHCRSREKRHSCPARFSRFTALG